MRTEQVGLLHHPKIPASQRLAEQIAISLQEVGVRVWIGSSWDEEEIIRQVSDLDMFITLGGDGTILRTARIAARYDIPILGVNLGRLGFLAELEPAEVPARLPQLGNGDYWLEERMMLHAEHRRDGELLGAYEALNDLVIARGSAARVVRLSLSLDSAPVTTYVADGLIAATATGSTAYNLSAGGPIASPNIQDILVTPIAPHLTPARSLVVPGQTIIAVDVATEYDAILTTDGQVDIKLQDGDQIQVTKSQHTAKFVRLGSPSYFYETLLERLRWPAR